MAGFSLIEILVTIVVTSVGLFGLAGLQTRLQLTEIDAYQQIQALLLLQDMTDRIATNRGTAANYVTRSEKPLGTGDDHPADCSTIAAPTVQKLDSCEWANSLKGAAETSEDKALTGAMVGARGCVEAIGSDSYLVTVVWQGLVPLSAPSLGVTCGAGDYDGTDEGSPCTKDVCRRAMTSVLRIGTM
jgi:type IV pilus assembly protein PilV